MFCLIMAVCLLAQTETRSVPHLYPVDDTDRDPSFRSFVKRLRSAAETRNAGALRKMVAEDIFVGPGDDDKGWTKFVARWRPEDEDSPVWSALSDMLSLGFVREHPSLFLSPYVVWRFPRELDPAIHLVVIRDKVALRPRPALKAPAVASLSFEIVRQLGKPQTGEDVVEWVPVRTLDGQSGYVNARDVMSPQMPRAQFGKTNGHWALIALEGQD